MAVDIGINMEIDWKCWYYLVKWKCTPNIMKLIRVDTDLDDRGPHLNPGSPFNYHLWRLEGWRMQAGAPFYSSVWVEITEEEAEVFKHNVSPTG